MLYCFQCNCVYEYQYNNALDYLVDSNGTRVGPYTYTANLALVMDPWPTLVPRTVSCPPACLRLLWLLLIASSM